MGKSVGDPTYRESVEQVFASFRRILNIERNTGDRLSQLDLLERALIDRQPLSDVEQGTLEYVQGLTQSIGTVEQQNALGQLIEDHKLFVSLTKPQANASSAQHPFFRVLEDSGWDVGAGTATADEFILTAYDLRGRLVVSQTRRLSFSSDNVAFNYGALTGVRSDPTFLSFVTPQENRLLTVVKPGVRWLPNIDSSTILDSLLTSVLFLGDLGYFPNTQELTYYENITIGGAEWPAENTLRGFSVPLPKGDGWVRLVNYSKDPQDGNAVLLPGPAITAESAGPILDNLMAFAETLKRNGIVLDVSSLVKIEVEPSSGSLRLPPDTRPFIYDAGVFSSALIERTNIGEKERSETSDSVLFTPSFFVYDAADDRIFNTVERQNALLLGLIDLLSLTSGRQKRPLSYIKAWDTLIDLHRYYVSREAKTVARIITKFGETIFRIIQYYVEELGQEGLEYFAFQLPLQPKIIDGFLGNPQRWFEFAKTLVDRAKSDAGSDIRQYWIDNYDRLIGFGRVLPFRRGGSGGGTPQNPPPAQGGSGAGPMGGPSLPPPDSASGIADGSPITAAFDTDPITYAFGGEIKAAGGHDRETDLTIDDGNGHYDDATLDGGLLYMGGEIGLTEGAFITP